MCHSHAHYGSRRHLRQEKDICLSCCLPSVCDIHQCLPCFIFDVFKHVASFFKIFCVMIQYSATCAISVHLLKWLYESFALLQIIFSLRPVELAANFIPFSACNSSIVQPFCYKLPMAEVLWHLIAKQADIFSIS